MKKSRSAWPHVAMNCTGKYDFPIRSTPISCSHALLLSRRKSLVVGGIHTCAILDNDQAKCWGFYSISLATATTTVAMVMERCVCGRRLGCSSAEALVAEGTHTCTILDNGQAKCWGFYSCQLGYGNNNRGDGPEKMGGTLVAVDLGAALPRPWSLKASTLAQSWTMARRNVGASTPVSLATATLILHVSTLFDAYFIFRS